MRAFLFWLLLVQLGFAQAGHPRLAVLSERARVAQERKDFRTAALDWKMITTILPKSAKAYSNLGMMYHFDHQYSSAIAAFLHASRLNPRLLAPQIFLGIDYYLTAHSAEAISHFKMTLALSPDNPTALLWLGMSYYALGSFDKAIQQLNIARQLDPHDSSILFYQSRAYSKLLFKSYASIRHINAESPLLKALRDKTPPVNRCEVIAVQSDLRSNRLSDAFALAKALINRSPQCACSWYWFGRSSEALALKLLDRFLIASPDSYRVHQLKAEYDLAIGDDDGAINEFRLALSQKPDAPQLHESLGNVFMSRHQYARAVPEYKAEIRINPYAIVSLERMGQAYAELQDPITASTYLKRALMIDPQSYEALRGLGKVDFERRNYQNAVKNYRHAIQVKADPEPAIFFELSKAYKALGNSAEAARCLKHFRQALKKRQSSAERVMQESISERTSHQ